MEDQELKYWLAWNKVKEIGPIRFSNLFRAFPTLKEAWNGIYKVNDIIKVLHISEITWRRIEQEKQKIDPDVELALLNKIEAKVVTIKDEKYPELLKNIYDPPPIIYYKGNFLEIMNKKRGIAIVGSRKATYYGKKVARGIAAELAKRGYVIVSGLARGIDTNAHLGSLEAGGLTIAVLGCGIDRVYPEENRLLNDHIKENGAIISEFPIRTLPEKTNFPRRNRIISGLTLGTLVVEAAEKSGALLTADFALDQGKEVFAIPGSIYSHLSIGCHNLIKQGAKLVSSYQDILDEFEDTGEKIVNQGVITECKKEDLTEIEKKVFNILSVDPMHIDEILEILELPFSEMIEALLSLELKNYIKEVEGKRYVSLK